MKKNKLNSKNPKYKSGRGYNDKEDESAKEKQTKILINTYIRVRQIIFTYPISSDIV